MFLTGSSVVKTVTGEDVTREQLGGASVHSTKSGVTHFAAENGEEALYLIRRLLSYMPQNNLEETPLVAWATPSTVLKTNSTTSSRKRKTVIRHV